VVTRVCVSVCLSAAACLHYCTDPDVTWGNGMATLKCVAEPRGNPPGPPHTLRMPAKTPLASDKIDTPAVCAMLSATRPFSFVHTAGLL